jgi:hypothetical protein
LELVRLRREVGAEQLAAPSNYVPRIERRRGRELAIAKRKRLAVARVPVEKQRAPFGEVAVDPVHVHR